MRRLTTEEFIKRAVEVHGWEYDYSQTIYQDMHSDVVIVCKKHGKFMQTPSNHLKGHGCHICHKIEGRRLSNDVVLRRFQKAHRGKYDYSLMEYKNRKTKIKIICPIHGIFEQTPEKHMVGHGCPKCCTNFKSNTELFVEKAKAVHGDLYDYSKVEYVNSITPVCIIDKDFGEFWQRPDAHVRGEGHFSRRSMKIHQTKKKNNSYRISRPEQEVYELLVAKFGKDDVMSQYRSEVYPFACDFYIVSLDLYIELNAFWTHGGHWFDSSDPKDREELLRIEKQRRLGKRLYDSYLHTWTVSDVLKRETAERMQLNYLVFWDNDLSDFHIWYDSLK